MTKTYIAFFILLLSIQCIPSAIYAQHQGYSVGPSILFETITMDNRAMARQGSVFAASVTDVSQVFNIVDTNNGSNRLGSEFHTAKTPMLLGVKLNPDLKDYMGSPVMSFSKSYSSYLISDSSEAELIALGITLENAKDYQYHVVVDDNLEMVPWSPVQKMAMDYGAKRPYALLGKFCAPGRRIMIEVASKKDYNIRDGVVFDWRTDYKPHVQQLLVASSKRYFNISYTNINNGYASRFDTASGLPTNLRFPVDSVEVMLFSFKKHETVAYSIYLAKTVAGKTDTTMLEMLYPGEFYIFMNKWYDKPGKYELLIHRAQDIWTWTESQTLRLPFEVLPPALIEKKMSLRQLLPYILGTLILIGLGFFAYYRYNKRRLKKAAAAGETISLQLKSIRSQLNPHFMFNALSAIQGLMNKNDVAAANHYLAKFADLTRQVLQTADAEMISLEDELKMLDDYLQMEKLRFGFLYTFDIDPAINLANTEIPIMLLQPFVENSVKHGIAGLYEKGRISVSVRQQDQTLILTVSDNGSGFDKEAALAAAPGYGLKLSARRLALLNERYKTQRVSLDIQTGSSGSIITLILDHWT